MRELRQPKSRGISGPLRLRSERRIFRREPAQKRARFIGSRRNHTHSRGRWEQGNGRRIDHLEKVETKRVQHDRGDEKSGDGHLAPARPLPMEEEISAGLRVRLGAHCCGVVASATEVIPRSSAAFVTDITRS